MSLGIFITSNEIKNKSLPENMSMANLFEEFDMCCHVTAEVSPPRKSAPLLADPRYTAQPTPYERT